MSFYLNKRTAYQQNTHAHTHTCTRTHTYTHIQTHTHVHTDKHTHKHTHINAHTHTYKSNTCTHLSLESGLRIHSAFGHPSTVHQDLASACKVCVQMSLTEPGYHREQVNIQYTSFQYVAVLFYSPGCGRREKNKEKGG